MSSDAVRHTVEARVSARRERHRSRPLAVRVAAGITGYLLSAVGVLLLLVPEFGLPLLAVGLGLLALEHDWAMRAQVWAELRIALLRNRLKRHSRALKIGVIVAIPVVLLATTTVVNAVVTRSEMGDIGSYGQRVPVDGKQMNVVVEGNGDATIVLLPGLGTAAPGLDFSPLIESLRGRYRVVAVEPFGTGLSDQTSEPRTAANISREVHEALQRIGVNRYVLMGHSIAGIYALTYSAAYAKEIVAFVGIDSSVPGQPGADEPIPTGALVALRRLGITRLLGHLAGDAYAGLPYDARTKEQMRLLSTKNAAAATMMDEVSRAPANFAAAREIAFPERIPLLLFVRSNDEDANTWMRLHTEQAASVVHGKVVFLEGDHYLHHTLSAKIAEDTTAFLDTLSS